MDTHHLKVFVAVFRSLSFSQAAEALRISQPTVSEHVKNLEAEMDCRLFDRLGRTIRPTMEAEILFPEATRLMEGMESIRNRLSRAGKSVSGKLVIGASTIPGTYLVPSLSSEFRKIHPGISYEILVADSRGIARMVTGHSLLLGIVGAQIDTERLECTPLFEDEIILVAPASMEVKKRVGRKELALLPLMTREEGSGTRRTVETHLQRAGVDPAGLNVTATLGSTESVKQSVKEGLGLSFLSRRAVQDELASDILRHIAVTGLRITREFTLIRHRKITLPNPYQACVEYIVKQGEDLRRKG